MTYLILNIIAQIAIGILLADAVSGFIHWLQDNYGRAHWPIVGGMIADNHFHHVQPEAFLAGSFFHRNFGAMIVASLFAAVFGFLGWITPVTVAALLVGGFANEIHALAHKPISEPVVWLLRRSGLIQTRAHHDRHHGGGVGTHYCVITAYLNPVLAKIKFWQGLEAAIAKVTGVKPIVHT